MVCRIARAAATALLLCAVPAAWPQESLRAPFAREAALGGTHAAMADDLSTLFANPAGFRSAGPELSLAEITVGLAGPIFDIAAIVVEGASGTELQDLLTSGPVLGLLQSLRARLGLAGPISFGYVGNGLGFGFFNQSEVSVVSSGVVPSISFAVREKFTLSGGYAFRIPLGERHTLDFGAMLKAFVRGEVLLDRDALGLVSLFQNLSLDLLTTSPFNLDVGIGIDAGLRYSIQERFSVGIVVRDAYAPYLRNSYETLDSLLAGAGPAAPPVNLPPAGTPLAPLDLSAGIAFRPHLGRLDRVISELGFYLDYSDILDFVVDRTNARNPILHVGIGVEVGLLDALSLRAGFGQGLFAAGLGIDLNFFRLNFSMFGQELSAEPGFAPTYNLLLGLEFRI